MREIKFRAWPTEDEQYSFMYFDLSEDGLNVPWIAKNCKVMQYTGLKDKNGVEIYEGDIVKLPKDLYIGSEIVAHKGEFHNDAFVEWVGGSFRLNKLGDKSKLYYGVLNFSKNTQPELLEVIGNIYENPELIKEDK